MLNTCTTSVSRYCELMSAAKTLFTSQTVGKSFSLNSILDLISERRGPPADIVGYYSALRYSVATLKGSKTSPMSSRICHSSGKHSRCTRSCLRCRMALIAGCYSHSHKIMSCVEFQQVDTSWIRLRSGSLSKTCLAARSSW